MRLWASFQERVSVVGLFEITCRPRLGCRLAAADGDAGIDCDHLCEDVENGLGMLAGFSRAGRPDLPLAQSYRRC
jgi:hypothetical protein